MASGDVPLCLVREWGVVVKHEYLINRINQNWSSIEWMKPSNEWMNESIEESSSNESSSSCHRNRMKESINRMNHYPVKWVESVESSESKRFSSSAHSALPRLFSSQPPTLFCIYFSIINNKIFSSHRPARTIVPTYRATLLLRPNLFLHNRGIRLVFFAIQF